MIEIGPYGEVPIRAAGDVQLVLQPLPVEYFYEGFGVGPVVLQSLLDLTVGGWVQDVGAEGMSFGVEEVYHQLQSGVQSVMEHGGHLLAAGSSVHLVVQLGQSVFPDLEEYSIALIFSGL